MKENVKIIYCNDENGNPIHYSKTTKSEKYFCIDCGSELICKDGDIKVKHLAHKNTDNCGGTGESIFHKHWKENLFKAGMFINIANKLKEPDNVEIIDVLNEVSLNNRYEKNWDNDIFVDVLLVTERGDIVVEINYKNPKNWKQLKPYYDELDLLRVFEVKVDKNVNAQLEWHYLGEEEETNKIKKEIAKEKRRITIENNLVKAEEERTKKEKKLEKIRLKEQEEKNRWNAIVDGVKNKVYTSTKILMNFKTPLRCIDNGVYVIKCLYENGEDGKYEPITLQFKLDKLKITKKKIEKDFNITKGIKYAYIIFDNKMYTEGYYNVLNLGEIYTYEYNKVLYAKLCNINQ